MKKNNLIALLLLICCSFISCISADVSNLKPNGDYEDKGDGDYVSLKKVDSLSEFGITYDEWNEVIGDTLLYKAYCKGINVSESRINQWACDALNIVGKNLNKTYGAIVKKNCKYDILEISNIGANISYRLGGSDKEAYIYYPIWYFNCYVLYFDDINMVPIIREVFGTANVYTIK